MPSRFARHLALAVIFALALIRSASAQERVLIPSSDGSVTLQAYLELPHETAKPRPAIVFLHGCGGLLTPSGKIESRSTYWAKRMTAAGYVVLIVDSFTSRGIAKMCSPATYRASIHRARVEDAFAALRYLQARPYVQPGRIAVMGWSQGGGVVLRAIAGTQRSFSAAVAFYPANCAPASFAPPWRSATPLLVLVGDADVWTPAKPCAAMIDAAAAVGSPARINVYANAYHDFDWPGLAKRELPAYRTRAGVVPIEGFDRAARDDAASRVPAFLSPLSE